jgi:hypothetical protein
MSRSLLCSVAAIFIVNWSTAQAATFRAETNSRGYTLYSTYEKPELCEVHIDFTFMRDGVREKGESVCLKKQIPEGKDVKFCTFSHERMVEPIITGPLKPTCEPLP